MDPVGSLATRSPRRGSVAAQPPGDHAGSVRTDSPHRPASRRPRLVVVGARQQRHGLGAYLARHLAAAGAEIVAVVGSRLATAQRAAAELEAALGHRPVPLAHSDDVERLPDLHGLVIAAPHEVHAPWLRWGVGRGLHVLCEKPLVWGGSDAASVAAAAARRCQQRGRHLWVLAQWPMALEALVHLHPGLELGSARRLEVHLSPPSRGPEMVPDSLPHALSLAYALCPDERPRLQDVRGAWVDEEGRAGTLAWVHVAGERRLEVEVRLEQGGASPRPLAWAVDGFWARREVGEHYAMELVHGERRVALPDPYASLAARFVRALAEGEPPRVDPSATHGVAHLLELAAALPALPVTEIPYP